MYWLGLPYHPDLSITGPHVIKLHCLSLLPNLVCQEYVFGSLRILPAPYFPSVPSRPLLVTTYSLAVAALQRTVNPGKPCPHVVRDYRSDSVT
jgi:hypothetical protein